MHVVVNHLHLREPLTDATVRAAREGVQRVVDAGALAPSVAELLHARDRGVTGRADGGGPWQAKEEVSK